MSLEGLPGVSQPFRMLIQEIRYYTRDFAQLNRLLRGEESSDRQIAWAILDAVEDFNGTPPMTGYSVEDLLSMHQSALLKRMAVVSLIESVAMLQTRNHVNYSDGGLNLGVNDKTPLLMNFIKLFANKTEQMKQRVKIALNISAMIGGSDTGVHSEYWATNATYIGL